MSVSSLPEWKQLLLEKKRKEEVERGRREKEEEAKLASMPAWKRGIIQRRKAKQEEAGDREKDKDVPLEVRCPSEALSDTDSSVTVNLGSEVSLSPDPGQWLDMESKAVSQVSVETIVPVHENPFIRTQSVWRKGREVDVGSEMEAKEKDKIIHWGQDTETRRSKEVKKEKLRDLTEGREKDRSRDRGQGRENTKGVCDKDKTQWKESTKEQDTFRMKKDTVEKETHPPCAPFSPVVPCLRTIRADNVIIIEQDRKDSDDRRGKWMETDRERLQEDQTSKRGMKMDLREILAGGGSVTEIRASEVLIIKPSVSLEDRCAGSRVRGEGEMKGFMEVKKESLSKDFRTDVCWQREREKEKPWGHATVINKDNGKEILDDNVFVEKGGRVSQLLSKFGEHPKPPSRSKSSDNFMHVARRKYSGDQDDRQSIERRADGQDSLLKSTPKRSFSFSDRVLATEENGCEKKNDLPSMDVPGKDKSEHVRQGCARLLQKDRRVKLRDELRGNFIQSQNEKVKYFEKRCGEEANADKGFTVASVKSTEGISFAKRVPIRQEAKPRCNREAKQCAGGKSIKDIFIGVQMEQKAESPVADESLDLVHEEPLDSVNDIESKRTSAFTECSSVSCLIPDVAHHKGPEWSGIVPQGPYLTVLSPQTEDLISKIEKLGDATIHFNEKAEKFYKSPFELEPQTEDESQDPSAMLNNTIGTSQVPLEIQIPRSVFYVAEEILDQGNADGPRDEAQGWEPGKAVERRDSWRVGKPLSRVESLREQMRQKELESQKHNELQDGDGKNAVEAGEDKYWEKGCDEQEHQDTSMRLAETAREQEEASQSSFVSPSNIRQEVCQLKTSPPLPVPLTCLHTDIKKDLSSDYATTFSEVASDHCHTSQDDHVDHGEGHLRSTQEEEEEEEEEEQQELSEEEDEEEDYTSSIDSEQSLSPSPPHPNSLAAMSRIYNLETVGSRSGLCIKERTVDISSSVHLVKVKPLVTNLQQSDTRVLTGDVVHDVQKLQQQVEQFKLKEDTDKRTKGRSGAKGAPKQQIRDHGELVDSKVCSPTSQSRQTITIIPSFLRNRSPENSVKPANFPPTPAPSPSTPSPSLSPISTPSPTPSPTLFSIKSAAGGHVKRGATITVTPRKTSTGGAPGPTKRDVVTGSPKSPTQQTTPSFHEPVKKKYPTVEEIEVIGGYQNLDKSCLTKSGGTPKRGKVCFHEDRLEQVCEYPSETSMLTFSPISHEMLKMEKLEEKKCEEESGRVELKSIKSIAVTPQQGKDESCPR